MAEECSAPGRCPVCGARFREAAACSRCGADLTPLMALMARAHALRQAARAALAQGPAPLPGDFATAAEARHGTPEGRRLRLLSAWLDRQAPGAAGDQAG